MLKDKNWTWSDLRFIAKKREFWGAVAVALVIGFVLGAITC